MKHTRTSRQRLLLLLDRISSGVILKEQLSGARPDNIISSRKLSTCWIGKSRAKSGSEGRRKQQECVSTFENVTVEG